MPRLFVESDAPEPLPIQFHTDPRDLLALLSFGVAAPFGSMHPLTQLVRHLTMECQLDLAPLLTFYDREVADAVDAANLAAAWQPATPLRDCVAAARAAIAADERAGALLAGFESIPALLADLERMAQWAADRGARIRLSFSLT